jgi:pantoate--beta-alanine ligase
VPELIETVAALRERLEALAPASPERSAAMARRRGFVPTMGALHEGHAALIRRAREESGIVVVSIFVNPTQFDRPEDLARYPRTLESDIRICRDLGVDIVFAPAVSEVYPQSLECSVEVGLLADHLCGKFRPGHFRGVATVVLKLFEMVRPDRAYFGEKDAQQLAIIKRMVSDFNLPVSIVEVATVREADGLALSSRNARLDPAERLVAGSLYQALLEARRLIERGDRDAAGIARAAAAKIPASDALRLEYLEIVDPESLQPVERVDGPVRIAGALWLGSTRLIDNLLVPLP